MSFFLTLRPKWTKVCDAYSQVSLDFTKELALTRFKGKKNTLRRDFVMPDYVKRSYGEIRNPNEPSLPEESCSHAALNQNGPPKKKQKEVACEEQARAMDCGLRILGS